MEKKKWGSIKSETYRKLEKALGKKGAVVTIGDPENEGVSHYYSSKLPPLVIGDLGTQRKLAVEVSSVEKENEELLHLLLKQTQKHAK